MLEIEKYIREKEVQDRENRAFVPDLTSHQTHQVTPFGVEKLSSVFFRSIGRIAYRIVDTTDRVIVFEHDCLVDGHLAVDTHPLVQTFAFTRAAGDLGFAEDILFISPPAALPPRRSIKADFDMTDEDLTLCAFGGASVRYAVFSVSSNQRVSLSKPLTSPDSVSEKNRLSTVFRIGGGLVAILAKLHSRGILHGNLTAFNVVIERKSHGNRMMKLRDFARATMADPISGTTRFNRVSRFFKTHEKFYMSPWELANGAAHFYSKSDEVFRAIEIIATLVNSGPDIRPTLLATGSLIEYKNHGRLFDQSSPWVQGDISQKLTQIEELVRMNLPKPEYFRIASLLCDISKLINS